MCHPSWRWRASERAARSIATYRASGYRDRKAEERPAKIGVAAGIV
jgi:L-rhamnose isomerase